MGTISVFLDDEKSKFDYITKWNACMVKYQTRIQQENHNNWNYSCTRISNVFAINTWIFDDNTIAI